MYISDIHIHIIFSNCLISKTYYLENDEIMDFSKLSSHYFVRYKPNICDIYFLKNIKSNKEQKGRLVRKKLVKGMRLLTLHNHPQNVEKCVESVPPRCSSETFKISEIKHRSKMTI